MWNRPPAPPLLEVSINLRLERQPHLQKSPAKKFPISSPVKYVAAINSQLWTAVQRLAAENRFQRKVWVEMIEGQPAAIEKR